MRVIFLTLYIMLSRRQLKFFVVAVIVTTLLFILALLYLRSFSSSGAMGGAYLYALYNLFGLPWSLALQLISMAFVMRLNLEVYPVFLALLVSLLPVYINLFLLAKYFISATEKTKQLELERIPKIPSASNESYK